MLCFVCMATLTPKGNMPKNTNVAGPYSFCAGCPQKCNDKQAKQAFAHKTCDPCDACFNYGSPACLDCGDNFGNFEFDGGQSKADDLATALLFNSMLKKHFG